FDHVKQQVILIKTVFCNKKEMDLNRLYQKAQQKLNNMEQLLHQRAGRSRSFQIVKKEVKSNITKNKFIDKVKTIKQNIHDGQLLQAVISQRFEVPFHCSRFMLYRALRRINPSPYMFYLDFDGLALAGSSPEVLSRLRGEKTTLLPIAGTRRRGKTDEE